MRALGLLVILIVGAAAAGLSKSLVEEIMAPSLSALPPNEVNQLLHRAAEEVNKGTPQMLDDETRLDSAVAERGTFIYLYTLVTVTADQVDAERFVEAMGPQIRSFVCTSSSMETFRELKVPVEYSYRGNGGEPAFTIWVDWEDC